MASSRFTVYIQMVVDYRLVVVLDYQLRVVDNALVLGDQ